jgi:hypothetical protein
MPTWDLGDSVLEWRVRNKCCRPLGLVLRVGAPRDTDPSDRTIKGPPYHTFAGRIDLIMDLQADKKVALSASYTDEVGNPTDAPADASVTYTVDDPTIINLTDNGDGTAEAAATGTLGTANVHVDATAGGQTLSGDLQIVVVAGLAERLTIEAGEPEEVTPDGAPPPPPPPPVP